MSQHTEIELKWSLAEPAYQALQGRLDTLLGAPRRLEQENQFFDSADLRLRRAAMNLRLRHEGGRVLLTCKRRLPSQGSAHCHDEWERWLDESVWSMRTRIDLADLLPLPEHIRAQLASAPLIAQGGFSNRRFEYRSGEQLLCLDRTDFAGRVDFELEIETADPQAASSQWSRRLAEWGIPWQEQPLTKFARFLALIPPGAPTQA